MKIYFADAFTNQLFSGNQAAICIAGDTLDERTMQGYANEIGFSETAFVFHIKDNEYQIRFFTPKKEIPLCGHATLAASKILFETTLLNKIRLRNIDGVELLTEKSGSKIKMRFPVYDTEQTEVPTAMSEALGIDAIVNARYNSENRIILIEIAETSALKDLQPDFGKLVESYTGINGVLVTAKSENEDYDFHYRYFWPWAGTNEDPVTGAVQTFLTKYWAYKIHKPQFKAFQSSARTGVMDTEIQGDYVFIYGEAVIVLAGFLMRDDLNCCLF